MSDLVDAGVAAEPGAQHALRHREAVHLLEHLHRDAHRLGLLGDPAQDRLTNPNRGVRAEAQAALGLEAIHRHDESEVSFFDQIEERKAAIAIGAGHVNDETEVGEDDPLARVGVAAARAGRQ